MEHKRAGSSRGWLLPALLSVVALVVNYIRRADETDAIYVMHHNYMISTFWWTLLWLVVSAPLWLFLFAPGFIAWSVIGLWYVWRCVRGWTASVFLPMRKIRVCMMRP